MTADHILISDKLGPSRINTIGIGDPIIHDGLDATIIGLSPQAGKVHIRYDRTGRTAWTLAAAVMIVL
jgi:hypothetical protein